MSTLLFIGCCLLLIHHFAPTIALNQKDGKPEPACIPLSVNIIIPLTGSSKDLLAQLQSHVRQTHGFNNIFCVTENKDDPAVPVIHKLRAQDPRVVHINAGRTRHCSQKNHNLIAGYHSLEKECDILVFCDSGHFAPPDWLQNLLSPLYSDKAVAATSAYHHVFPASSTLAIYSRAVCVTTLHLLRRLPFVSQPWGGATAIRTTDFKAMNIIKAWSSTIVDDVVLAEVLQQQKKKLVTVNNADTRTYINSPAFSSMISWLIRQIAYLKFIFPKTWFFLGFTLFSLSLGLYCALSLLTVSTIWEVPWQVIFLSILYITFFLLFSFFLRIYHPSPGSPTYWYIACILCSALACWCHAKTWFTAKIIWGETIYTVADNGRVIHLERLK